MLRCFNSSSSSASWSPVRFAGAVFGTTRLGALRLWLDALSDVVLQEEVEDVQGPGTS